MDDALTIEGAIECVFDILTDEDSGFTAVEMLGILEVVKAMVLEGPDDEDDDEQGELEIEPEACPTIRTAI